ncbi:Delta(24)-sterol reductase [Porphyridium purpureum]|uniref:Delta(24)-sterol reductase n=1 Tax=Porphyridium purpureum TaxID=35688 RepID=A0A5J4YKE5_PORPP|nr:Delta(24)-sterol reductase [Porphyridium purpureum]|eukprot:POR2724..scf244_11
MSGKARMNGGARGHATTTTTTTTTTTRHGGATSSVLYVALQWVTVVLQVMTQIMIPLGSAVIDLLRVMGVWEVLTDVITRYRAPFVVIFVLPLSLMFDCAMQIRSYIIFKLYSAPELHEERVLDVQRQVALAVANAKAGKGPKRLCTARPGWLSISMDYRTYKQSSAQISISMYDILGEVQPITGPGSGSGGQETASATRGSIWVEPMVSMGQISHFLNPRGWTLPILPEMDDLTVGGLLMGVGIETSCHKYGLFSEMVEEYEVVLGNSERIFVRRDNEYADLFHALPWSYGTLGFLVSVKLIVVPCKPWVRLRYHPARSLEKGVSKFRALCDGAEKPDFVESLAFSRDTMVVMEGDMVDEDQVVPGARNEIGRFYMPWFYKHVEEILESGADFAEEFVPIRDYYHRHTKSIFWELEHIIPGGNHPFFRYLFGWLVPPKVSFLKLTQTEGMQSTYESMHVAQDFLLPLKGLQAQLEFLDDKMGIYPIWLCPHKHYNSGGTAFLRDPVDCNAEDEIGQYEMYVDIGLYGFARGALEKKKDFNMKSVMREVENYLLRNHGFQMMYADTYQSREEFLQMFNHEHYFKMREKYHATEAFGLIYDKMARKHTSA